MSSFMSSPGKTKALLVLTPIAPLLPTWSCSFWEFRPFLQRSLPSRCNRILMQRHQMTKCRHIMIYLKLFHVSCRKKAPIKKSHKQMQESHKQSFAKCNFLRFFQLLKKQYYARHNGLKSILMEHFRYTPNFTNR